MRTLIGSQTLYGSFSSVLRPSSINPDTLRYSIFHGIFEIGGEGGTFLYAKNNALCVTFLYTKTMHFALHFYLQKASHFALHFNMQKTVHFALRFYI